MSVFHIKRRSSPYVQIDKTCLNDRSLSYRAKGVLCYLLSKPPHWKVRMHELTEASKEGRDAVRVAIKELIAAGYVKLTPLRGHDGKMEGQEYWVFETPKVFKNSVTELLKTRPTVS